jgi:hypothetical protein
MGTLSEQLRKEFTVAIGQKVVPIDAILRGEENAEEFEAVDELIDGGYHPIHAVYMTMANLLSMFVEEVAGLPFLHQAHEFLLKAEDLYTPGYPPISPITLSHYHHWSCFDVSFGTDHETLGECFFRVVDLLGIDPVQVEAVEKLCCSRLGLYQILNASGGTFRIRELVTGRETDTIIPTGFRAEAGSMALVRVLPPLTGICSAHVAVTTPYMTIGTCEKDWLEYFERHQILAGAPGAGERLHRHMNWYWCEFLFNGYVNHRSDAIFVAGIPDRPETQPQHSSFDEKTFRY